MIVTVSNESIISAENRRLKHGCLACVELEGASLCASVPREHSERVDSVRLSNYGGFPNIRTACELVPIASSEEAGSSSDGLFAKGSGLTAFQWLDCIWNPRLQGSNPERAWESWIGFMWLHNIFHVQTDFENYKSFPSLAKPSYQLDDSQPRPVHPLCTKLCLDLRPGQIKSLSIKQSQ